jgi:hypothetical protein
MTISMSDEDFDFMREKQSKGVKPAQVFRNAINSMRKDAQNTEINKEILFLKAHINKLDGIIYKYVVFHKEMGLNAKFDKWDNDGKDRMINEVES